MEEKLKTLREHLDQLNIGPGSNAGFVIVDGNVEMQVSRRYLESAPMQCYLDMNVILIKHSYVNIYGVTTILFVLA